MTDHTRIVDLIERASDSHPFCGCGWHTTPVWRDDVVWLECASVTQPRQGIVARLIAAATAPIHVHIAIVDIPARATPRLAVQA